ncbi:coiled-coil domain-containing protein 114 [Oryzias melastigma]|uniref:Outer dynein arm protein 1-like n=1 Tax=Oryzias melastigma TaxID=30732 RepID=A0A3B3E2L2_ORYME|nr:coiled-coil domain-containing protein 114 [Oryzias melastigma]
MESHASERIMGESLHSSVIWDQDFIRKPQEDLQHLPAIHVRHPDSPDRDGLQSLIQKKDILDQQLESESQEHQKLQKEVSSAKLSLEELRKEVVRDTSKTERLKTQKAIRTLEYKRHRASIDLNVQVAKTRGLGEELQTLYNERTSFQQLYNKMNKELRDVRKKIREEMIVCAAADHERLEVQSKMAVTQEQAGEALTQTKAEILKLNRVIALEMTRRDFKVVKSSGRGGLDSSGGVTPQKFPTRAKQNMGDSGVVSLDALTEAFEKIQAASGVDDLDVLVNNFIKNEQKIFEQMSFLNIQQAKVTAHKELSSEIQAEIDSLRAEHLQQKEALSVSHKTNEEQWRRVESQIEDCEHKCITFTKIREDFEKELHSIPFTSLWKQLEIPEDDTTMLMSLLEQITNYLLTIQVLQKFKKQEKNPTPSKKKRPDV